jgi:excisionase family DNA binding protein
MQNIIRLTPSQAAQMFGVNERSIRRAISNGDLRYILVQGRYKINFEDLVKWSQKMPSRVQKRDEQGIGQYVEKWRIKNPKYSPSKKLIDEENNPENKN